jgi:phage-related minor tail protein
VDALTRRQSELEAALSAASDAREAQQRQIDMLTRALETRARELTRQTGGTDVSPGLLLALAGGWSSP